MSRMNTTLKRTPSSSPSPTDLVRVLVGPEEQEFTLSRKTLFSASPFFRTRLASPVLRLPQTLPSTFKLFALHLHHPRTFTTSISTSITALDPETCLLPRPLADASRLSLHWALVHLHLFSASVSLPALQDAAMDAIQDLYLHYDWEVSPSFVRYLYSCEPLAARRLRKWGVAMVAWCIALAAHVSSEWQAAMDACAGFRREYDSHLSKMAGIGSRGVDVRVKNPQLRLPRNGLRTEERYFGFRLCSFHSHRAVVGEGGCLHGGAQGQGEVEGWCDVVDLEREEKETEKKALRRAMNIPELERKPVRAAVNSASKPEIRVEGAGWESSEEKPPKDRLARHNEEDEDRPEPPRNNSVMQPPEREQDSRPKPPQKNNVTPPNETERKPSPVPKDTLAPPGEQERRPLPVSKDTLALPKEKEQRKPSPVSMLILDGFYLDV